jgi:Ni/Co efflux regulator RcnB
MKKIILAAVAASTLLAVPAAANADVGRNDRAGYSQRNDRDHQRVERHSHKVQAHRWQRGQRFDRRYASNYQVINNYRAYRLNAPPRGYRYVRSNNDIVMVAVASGIIGAVFGNAF